MIKKIIHIIPYFSYGGAEIFVKELAKEQQKEIKFSIEIWCFEESKNKKFQDNILEDLKEKGIIVRFLTKEKNRIRRFINLYRFIKKYRPDIINTHLLHTTVYTALAKVLIRGKSSKILLFETIHNTKIEKPLIQRIITNYLIDRTIVISEKVREIFLEELKIKNNKMILIENGININFNFNFQIKDKVKRIISIGRLSEQKNHIFLLKSYKYMIEKGYKDIPIVDIYGEGDLKNTLEEFIKRNKLENFIKLKGLTNNPLKELFKSDIYVMPSNYEGLSIALLEALAVGIPILATKVNGIKDILNENIFEDILIENGDIVEFANKFMELVNNKDKRKKLSLYEVEKSKNYSIEKTAIKYNDAYKIFIGE